MCILKVSVCQLCRRLAQGLPHLCACSNAVCPFHATLPSALPAAALCGHHALRKEVNLLSILHHSGYADRVPPVLGVVQHLGSLKDMVRCCGCGLSSVRSPPLSWHALGHALQARRDESDPLHCLMQPLYGYAMPAYHYGSLASLIRDTCDRCGSTLCLLRLGGCALAPTCHQSTPV